MQGELIKEAEELLLDLEASSHHEQPDDLRSSLDSYRNDLKESEENLKPKIDELSESIGSMKTRH